MAVTFPNTQCIRFSAQGDAVTGKYLVQCLQWSDTSASADHIQVSDTAGNTVWHTHSAAADRHIEQYFHTPLPMDGIVVTTLTNGEVTAYVV